MKPEPRLTFNKSERLRHKTLVDTLFTEGNHITIFPMRLTWRTLSDKELKESFRDSVPDKLGKLQVMFTVPKKKLRRAVDRVAMRRRMRESWRLQRLPLKEILCKREDVRSLSVAVIYLADKRNPMTKISARMEKLIDRLAADLSMKNDVTEA